MLRLFIAIDLPESLKAAIGALQDRLRSGLGPAARAARWVDPAGTHLTLAFLGNVDAGSIDAIGTALEAATTASSPFELRTAGLGAFPNVRRPRHLWLGVTGDRRRLDDLQDRVAAALEPIGFPRERRPFSPHLTLARIRQQARPDDLTVYSRLLERGASVPAQEIPVDEIVLFRSELTPAGSIYSRLAAWPLDARVGSERVLESGGHDDVQG